MKESYSGVSIAVNDISYERSLKKIFGKLPLKSTELIAKSLLVGQAIKIARWPAVTFTL